VNGHRDATQPAAALLATDTGGQEETIQKHVDGILSTPPWDKNTCDAVYEFVCGGTGANVSEVSLFACVHGTITFAFLNRGIEEDL